MIDANIKYKFYLYSHIYFSKVENKLLLYDTKTGKYIESNSFAHCELIEEIYEPANLGVIELMPEYLKDAETIKFIDDIINQNFGKIIPIEPNMPPLVNLLPILNLQDDVERLKNDPEHDIGEKALRYLNELNIYLTDLCNLNCSFCDYYFKQIKSCHKENKNTHIQIDKIKDILDNLECSSLKRINFLGGNLFLYTDLHELIELLKDYDFDFHYWIHIENLSNANLDFDYNKDIIINFPIHTTLVKQYIEDHKEDKKATYHFLIENESQYNDAESIIKLTDIDNYQITPVYTGSNISFFENNICLGKEDIFAAPIPHRIIFCNQKLNSNHFGKLSVLPDGSVKANMNTSILGNIYENSILEIISSELNINTAWRVIRNEKPCNQCLYQYLCPPPSNYETVIGKPNLCQVEP
jgi:pseudo-rSAM protein